RCPHRHVRAGKSAHAHTGRLSAFPLLLPGKTPVRRTRDVNEGAMRGNVLQTWTPTLLFLTVLITATAPAGRYRTGKTGGPRLFESASPAECCARPAPMPAARRVENGQRVSPRQTAAMLVMLMGQHGRLIGFAR